MAAANLDTSLALIFGHEGGFVNHKKSIDPGGATNFGITIGTLSAYRKRQVTVDEVRALSKAEAREILVSQYARPIRYNDLPAGLDHSVLDFCVHSGPSQAVKSLQTVLGFSGADRDGIIGHKTLAAIKSYPGGVMTLIRNYNAERLEFFKRLRNYEPNKRGWIRRVTGRDIAGKIKDTPGIIGESLQLAKTPLETPTKPAPVPVPTPDPVVQDTGKALPSETAITKTTRGKWSISAVISAVTAAASLAVDKLTEYQHIAEPIMWIVVGATIVTVIGAAYFQLKEVQAGE